MIDGERCLDEADELESGAVAKPNGWGNGHNHASGPPQAPIEDITAALELIPNDDLEWEEWNRLGMAIWRASGGSPEGFKAFDGWSQRSDKYDADETRFRWNHYYASPPDSIGFGTLVYEARQTEPDWEPPSRRHSNGAANETDPGAGADREALARGKMAEMRRRCEAFFSEQAEALRVDPELAGLPPGALGRLWEEAEGKAKGGDPGEGTAAHLPLRRILNPVELHGLAVPPRRWIATDWIPWGYATALYGAPGVGKSLIALDLQVALALGRPSWLGIPISGPVRSFGFYCEDDEGELHRRLAAICAKYGASLKDLENMRVEARLTQNNILMTFENGVGTPTDLFHEVCRDVKDFGASLAIWDTVADGFAGNQNDMGHARQFVRGQHSLARFIGGAALSLAHPSLAGQASHSGQSGSIQWDAAFRSRLYLSWPDTEKGGEDDAGDQDARILTRKKANYAARGATIPLRWAGGAFVVDECTAARPAATEVFLQLLDEVTEEGQPMSNSDRASNYAPKIFVRRPGRCGYKVGDFAAAMQQLFSERKITLEEYRTPDRKTREKIVRVGVAPKFETPNPWDKTPG
jgi:hypothetical protein